MEDGLSFDLALSSIDHNGWSVDQEIHPSAWIRLRYMMATFREEILEMSLCSSISEEQIE